MWNDKYKVVEGVTDQQILDYGFTNYNKPTLYFARMLDKYVSINVSISKKTRKVKVEVLFEEFLQHADISRNKELTDKANKIVSKLVSAGLIEKM